MAEKFMGCLIDDGLPNSATAELLPSQQSAVELLTNDEKLLATYLDTSTDIEEKIQAIAARLSPAATTKVLSCV